MGKTWKKLVVCLLALLLSLGVPLLAGCGDDDESPAAPTAAPTPLPTAPEPEPTVAPEPEPEPTVAPEPQPQPEPEPASGGPTWTYNVNYGDENIVATVSVIGEETVDGVECFVTEASYDVAPYRAFSTSDTLLKVYYIKDWVSKTTLDIKDSEIGMNALEMMDLTVTINNTYSSEDHGAPLSVGKAWSGEFETSLDPEVSPPNKASWEVEVVAIEEVTVPAGTFECYRVEIARVVMNDEPLEVPTIRTEWWSTQDDFLAPVKVEEGSQYQLVETLELVSYSE